MNPGRIFGLPLLLPLCAAAGAWESTTLGPSLSWRDGAVVGLEASLVRTTGSMPLWATAGGSVRTDRSAGAAYLEAGTWSLLTLGIGASLGPGRQEGLRNHAFVGFPIPLHGITDSRQPGLYIEPYYRPSFAPARGFEIRHETGLLLKFAGLQVGSWNRAKAPARPDLLP